MACLRYNVLNSSKIWSVPLYREMSPSQELGAQDVFKNKCLINLRWYRLATTPPPRASDREADPPACSPQPQWCNCASSAAVMMGWAPGGSPFRRVCGVLHGFPKAAWKSHWLLLLSLLTWKAILFTPSFFFFLNDMNPSKVNSRVLWKRVKPKLDYQNKTSGGHDWSLWNTQTALQTWKKNPHS